MRFSLRSRNSVLLAAGLGLALIFLLGGCALSPQQVMLRPTVSINPLNIGNGREVYVDVVDARPQKAFGARGGIYATTSLITPAGDITAPVRAAIASGLVGYGFAVTPDPKPDAIKMKVQIEEIGYQGEGSPTVRKVNTRAAVKVTIDNGAKEYTGRYQVKNTRGVLTAPSEADNDQMINDIVSKVLQRMMTDKELVNFLQSGTAPQAQ